MSEYRMKYYCHYVEGESTPRAMFRNKTESLLALRKPCFEVVRYFRFPSLTPEGSKPGAYEILERIVDPKVMDWDFDNVMREAQEYVRKTRQQINYDI